MIDIILMNMLFWPLWIALSYIPQKIAQNYIDGYGAKVNYLSGKK